MILSRIMQTFLQLFRNDDIQEFDSKWDDFLILMTQIPSDDILESLYKLIIRESEKLKTVLELSPFKHCPLLSTANNLPDFHTGLSHNS